MTPRKILLVDDSLTSLFVARRILERSPHVLVSAASGEEALQRARSERPDLILLDVVMPGIDGFETLRRLREIEATRNTPVIFVTTRGEPELIEAGYGKGCSDYVVKPIDAEELRAKVDSLLGAA